jgi:hypothetical protein
MILNATPGVCFDRAILLTKSYSLLESLNPHRAQDLSKIDFLEAVIISFFVSNNSLKQRDQGFRPVFK